MQSKTEWTSSAVAPDTEVEANSEVGDAVVGAVFRGAEGAAGGVSRHDAGPWPVDPWVVADRAAMVACARETDGPAVP